TYCFYNSMTDSVSSGSSRPLKGAVPTDLPSYPSSGRVDLASAGAAASLAHANHKPFQHWQPEAQPHADRAAKLVKDFQQPSTWQPELSAAGSKAALLAVRDSGITISPVPTPDM